MNENIEKPMILARQEFINKLVEDINGSGLPMFVVEPILRDVYAEVKTMMQKQYEAELTRYEIQMQEMQMNNEQQGQLNDE